MSIQEKTAMARAKECATSRKTTDGGVLNTVMDRSSTNNAFGVHHFLLVRSGGGYEAGRQSIIARREAERVYFSGGGAGVAGDGPSAGRRGGARERVDGARAPHA